MFYLEVVVVALHGARSGGDTRSLVGGCLERGAHLIHKSLFSRLFGYLFSLGRGFRRLGLRDARVESFEQLFDLGPLRIVRGQVEEASIIAGRVRIVFIWNPNSPMVRVSDLAFPPLRLTKATPSQLSRTRPPDRRIMRYNFPLSSG